MSACSNRLRALGASLIGVVLAAAPARAQWVEFIDQTETRLVASAALGTEDFEEKDFAWGDVDKDGDIDLVVVRKEPFTTSGKRVNVLFLNEGGVLVERTAEFVVDSDVPGDLGFETPTNDRDVQLADLDLDGWLDIVTAVTLSDGDSKAVGYPRIYRNKGRDPDTGDWLGFRYEAGRIPFMLSYTGENRHNPRFCAVAVGDLDGDDAPDLYFSDYDTFQLDGADFNDRLLVNRGDGYFDDETTARLQGTILIPELGELPFEVSAFGAAAAIADMNGDGRNDIVKQTALEQPRYVGVAYNSPNDEGFFDTYQAVNLQAPYFVSVGDLNNDGRLDIVVTDDGQDRYLLNMGNDRNGLPEFLPFGFSYDAAGDDGFGSNSLIVDLNNDGWNDVLIADVDVDDGGCGRRMHIYRNLGGAPGAEVTLQEQTSGSGCLANIAECLVAGVPANMLTGVHDVAIFDLDGDGWKDMVLGRCDGTQVYISDPPAGLVFGYPLGLPVQVVPDEPKPIQVRVKSFGIAVPQAGSARLHASREGGPFEEVPLTALDTDLYEGELPGTACAARLEYWVEGMSTDGEVFTDPVGAPADTYRALSSLGTELSYSADVELPDEGWTVTNHPSLQAGGWERAVPVGTIDGFGEQSAPSDDAQAGAETLFAYVTGNGAPGEPVGAHDVDGGPTELVSPPINLAAADGTLSYNRWFYANTPGKTLEVEITNDGEVWLPLETVAGAANSWNVFSFRVSDFVEPTAHIQLRFRVSDSPNTAIVEAGVDNIRLERLVCNECTADEECADESFCNGTEDCLAGSCVPGLDPCPGEQCDEAAEACLECLDDLDCDDGSYCNGIETCSAGVCASGLAACAGSMCDETIDSCVECLAHADCDDAMFCNGLELCSAGSCVATAEPCPGRTCDETGDRCAGEVSLQPRLGQPLDGLTAEQLERFELGRELFDRKFEEGDGLGPLFNQSSCGSCHNVPLGGSGTSTVTRFGFNDDKGGGFDPLDDLGGSLRQAEATDAACLETVPTEANVVAKRVTTSTLGLGLVEAVPDASILSLADAPPPGISGRVHLVPVLERPGEMRVGRMGWKAQLATLLSFSADAARNEMGITNRLIGDENAPNGDAVLLAQCDGVSDPEDGPDAMGVDFIDRVTDFQRFLAPPPQTPRSGMSGEASFAAVGCVHCHRPTLETSDDPELEPAFRGRTIRPYSDYLLHDMGQAADFIAQGDAGQREIKTPPLWGLRVRDPLWHDGRFVGGSFESRVGQAIDAHAAFGSEAEASAVAYSQLSDPEQEAVLAFLGSLGRPEFDLDGDGSVGHADYAAIVDCLADPEATYTPDDACAVSDGDQDGDVDEDDFALFLLAADGPAGSVSDGGRIPGVPLQLERGEGEVVLLSWGVSCLSSDLDYAVYQGEIGDFANPSPLTCSTGGSITSSVPASGPSRYFLVVPTNGFREGAYGVDSEGNPRPSSETACFPQSVGTCQ